MTKTFAGFGARKSPENILLKMEQISKMLGELGFTLRSGGAIGADSSFEKTASKKEIFRAKDATKEAYNLSSQFHPAWVKLESYVQALHARNAMIVLGRDLCDPVEFGVCWTPNGKIVGGTGQAIRIAESRGIKIYNIAIEKDLEDLREMVRGLIQASKSDYSSRAFTPNRITKLKPNEIFVFGSNSSGFHGAGSAGLACRGDSNTNWRSDQWFLNAINSIPDSEQRIGNWAVYGVARGFQEGRNGSSYAIETILKPGIKRSIPLGEIARQIYELNIFAIRRPDLVFLVTKIGSSFAGYSVEEIKKLFIDIPNLSSNIILPIEYEHRISLSKEPKEPLKVVKTETVLNLYDSALDGINHINVYSKGKTSLGRFLTNFSKSPFNCEDGAFESVEGYWYWLGSSKDEKAEPLRKMSGFEAKKFGREIGCLDWIDGDEFKVKIIEAISSKIRSNPSVVLEFKKSKLPFVHYYDYKGKIVKVPKADWIMEGLESLRKSLN